MKTKSALSRRNFLQLAGAGLGAFFVPTPLWKITSDSTEWPTLRLETLPQPVQEILSRVTPAQIRPDGRLELLTEKGLIRGTIPLAQTQWNKERSHIWDRLYTTVPWAIVLHWYGDRENFDKTVAGYLRGFDSLRDVEDYTTRTSTHFLVGEEKPSAQPAERKDPISILQTQAPDKDGVPFVGSHISGLDYFAHRARRQYFVRALYQLGYEEPGVHSVLQDWFDGGRFIDPNMRTIAIEACGYDFESTVHFPPSQQIANIVTVVWALMRRYRISANNLLGHHEIQLNKNDPGKKFLALVRYLIGCQALLKNDRQMNYLVFGNFLKTSNNPQEAVQKYFKFVYDHLLLVSTPQSVYEWESIGGYWFLSDQINGHSHPLARIFRLPLIGDITQAGRSFVLPENHEGSDLYLLNSKKKNASEIRSSILIADGVCQYLGTTTCCSGGNMAIFRHRQSDGAEILSIYSHLDEMADLQVGQRYPEGMSIGSLRQELSYMDPFLHFAVAYGGTWNTDLQKNYNLPPNIGVKWIYDRFHNPITFLAQRLPADERHNLNVEA